MGFIAFMDTNKLMPMRVMASEGRLTYRTWLRLIGQGFGTDWWG